MRTSIQRLHKCWSMSYHLTSSEERCSKLYDQLLVIGRNVNINCPQLVVCKLKNLASICTPVSSTIVHSIAWSPAFEWQSVGNWPFQVPIRFQVLESPADFAAIIPSASSMYHYRDLVASATQMLLMLLCRINVMKRPNWPHMKCYPQKGVSHVFSLAV